MTNDQTLKISLLSTYNRTAKTAQLIVGYHYNDHMAHQTKTIQNIGPLRYNSSYMKELFTLAGGHIWAARNLLDNPPIDTVEIRLVDFTPEDLPYLKQLLHDTPELWETCLTPIPDKIKPVSCIRFALADMQTDQYMQYLKEKITPKPAQ